MIAALRKPEPSPEPTQPLLAADIAARLEAAEAEQRALEAQVGDLALDKELGKSGAERRLATLNQRIQDGARSIAQLRAAREAAGVRDAATMAAARHKVRLRSLTDFQAVVKRRQDAAVTLAESIAQASAAYRVYVETQQALRGILPLDVRFDEGELQTITELQADVLASAEMYRTGVLATATGHVQPNFALPGAACPDLRYLNNPSALPTLVERVEQATTWLLSVVHAKVQGLAPVEGSA